MAKACPTPIDVTDLQFKLQCRLKVFNNKEVSTFSSSNSLVTCASRYGLLFVGTNLNEFQAIQTNALLRYSPKDKDVVSYNRRTIQLPSAPKHLIINCDSTILAVVIEKDQCPTVIFYETLSFLRQNVKIIKEVRLSATPNVYVREVNWNPSLPNIFTACKSDSSLGVYELKGDSVDINELPAAAGATCFCWSPKGKQLSVGSKDGKITQYKPDLKAVKAISAPKLDGPVTIISLQWVSNYQFIGVYQMVPDGACCVIVIDAPKTGEPAFTNYDDICYSGSSRPAQFYMVFQQAWNFLMVASANSTEVGVLANNGDSWIQWITSDTARAELPLNEDHQETFPIGLTFDISPTERLPWGESTIPPCPLLCILSHQGVLCVFNVVYLKEGVPSICAPPDPINDLSGLSMFVSAPTSTLTVTPLREAIVTTQVATAPTAIIQSTPIVTKGNNTDTLSKSLFGGQAIVTPIKPQQRPQGTSLFGGQTSILPVSKPQPQASASSSSLNEKYSSIFSSLNQGVPASLSSAVPVKPIVVNAVSKSEAKPQVTKNLQPQQPQVQAAQAREVQDISTPKKLDLTLLNKVIVDEQISLNGEISQLIKMGRSLQLNVGTDKEMVNLIEQIDALQEFVKDAVEISQGQSSEIHCLKQNLIQSWAWFEEAKSLYNASKNEVVNLLIKVQSLDSLSEKRLKDINQLAYYIESQITLADKALDEQWDSFQDYTKKGYKQKLPTVDSIFQTMVNQNAILQKQTYVLKTVSMRLKQKKSKISSLLISVDKDRDLVEDFQSLSLNPDDLLKLQVEKIKSHSKKLTATKIKKLQSFMKDRPVTRVKAIKPQVSSWTFTQSPSNSKVKSCLDKLNASATSVSTSLDLSQDELLTEHEEAESTPPAIKTGLKSSQSSAFAPLPQIFKPQFQSPSVEFKTSASSSFANTQPVKAQGTSSAFIFSQINATTSTTGFDLSTAGNLFGAKTSNQNAQTGVQVSNATTSINTNIAGKCLKLTDVTGEQQKNLAANLAQTPSNVITVSLFGNKTDVTSSGSAFPAAGMTFKNIFSGVTSQSGIMPTSTNINLLQNTSGATNSTFSSGSTDLNKTSFGFVNSPTSPVNLNKTESNQNKLISSNGASNTTSVEVISPKTTTNFSSAFSSSLFNASKTGSAAASSAPSFLGSNMPAGSASIVGSAPSSTSNAGSTQFGLSKTATTANSSTNITSTSTSGKSIFGAATTTLSISDSTLSSSDGATITSNETVPTVTSSTTTSNEKLPLFGSLTIIKPTEPTMTSQNAINTNITPAINTTSATVTSSVITEGDIATVSAGQSIQETSKTTTPSVFSSVTLSSVVTPPITTQSLFGVATSSSSVFSSPISSGAATTNQDNLFAAKAQQPLAGAASPFRSSTISTSKSEGTSQSNIAEPVFKAATSSSSSVFGGASGNNIFAPKATTSQSAVPPRTESELTSSVATTVTAFGAASTVVGSDAAKKDELSIKATPVTVTTTTSSSIFGSQSFTSPPPSTTTSIFGAPSTSSAFGNAPFGNVASTFGASNSTSSSGSFFGSSTVSATGNIFGTATNSGSIFGAPPTTTTAFSPSAGFGGASSTFGTTPAVTTVTPAFGAFGAPAATPASSNNIFLSPSTASGSTFGTVFATTTTASGSSVFGTPAAPAVQQPTSGNFGFGGLSMGGTGASSGSIFGGNSGGSTFGQQANPFGKVEPKPSSFGSSATNIFGSPSSGTTSRAGSIFGAASTATPTGSTPSAFTQPTFGSSSPFGGGSAFDETSTFGQPSVFSQSAFGTPQSQGGPFSGGGATPVAQTGFGSPAAFPKPGFGAAPVFGSSTFGSPPSFGGAPSFGAAPVFGSPQKVFGSPGQTASTGGFGAAAAQPSTGFGNLASQNTIGFGSLAQQANTGSSMPFSGSSSFTSWR